jgi:hypothetical protein
MPSYNRVAATHRAQCVRTHEFCTTRPWALPLDPAGALGHRPQFHLFRDWHWPHDSRSSPQSLQDQYRRLSPRTANAGSDTPLRGRHHSAIGPREPSKKGNPSCSANPLPTRQPPALHCTCILLPLDPPSCVPSDHLATGMKKIVIGSTGSLLASTCAPSRFAPQDRAPPAAVG